MTTGPVAGPEGESGMGCYDYPRYRSGRFHRLPSLPVFAPSR
jgi:hypothetical protein